MPALNAQRPEPGLSSPSFPTDTAQSRPGGLLKFAPFVTLLLTAPGPATRPDPGHTVPTALRLQGGDDVHVV